MMGPDPVVTTSPSDAPLAYLPEQRPVRQRADPAERGPVGEPPTNLSSLLGTPAHGGGGEQQAPQQQQRRMILASPHDARQVTPSSRGADQQLQQPQQYAKAGGVPSFAGNNNVMDGIGNDPNPQGSTAHYGGGGGNGGRAFREAPRRASDSSRLHSRNNLLLHLQPLQVRGGSRPTSRGSPAATDNNSGQPQRHQQQQQQQQQQRQRQLQAVPSQDQRRRHQPPTHLQQQTQQAEHQHQQPHQRQHQRRDRDRDRDRALNPPTSARTNFVPQAGATPPARHNTPGEIWLCNSEGRFIVPAGGPGAAAAADAAARDGVPTGSSSPIITALQAKASPEKVLAAPMAVKSGSPSINSKCPECQELVRARLDEPVLLREQRHCDGAVFGENPLVGGAAQEREEEEEVAAAAGGRNAVSPWRLRNKTRTGHVGLILCLNIGTDPPDVMRTAPCAVKECWIDPTDPATSPEESMDAIGHELQKQYETLQPKAKYRRTHDPTTNDVRKLCTNLRSVAGNHRALIHYNGHGVPRPTANGEIWVFNSSYTQYIPLSVHQLKDWAGTPAIFVLDCSAAGVLLKHFVEPQLPMEEGDGGPNPETPPNGDGGGGSAGGTAAGGVGSHQQPRHQQPPSASSAAAAAGLGPFNSGGGGGYSVAPSPASSTGRAPSVASSPVGSGGTLPGSGGGRPLKDVIVMAPCGAREALPSNPDLPADLFTSCLTTPMRMALRWFVRQNKELSMSGVNPAWVEDIPGELGNRLTPLGELEWIFTAMMDSIAWSTLPLPLFRKLFRRDLLVAKLFRNFLLADRILRSLNCTPVTHPAMPMTCHHPLWQFWDFAVEQQVGRLISATRMAPGKTYGLGSLGKPGKPAKVKANKNKSPGLLAGRQDGFFQGRLKAFEVWLQFAGGSSRVAVRGGRLGDASPPSACGAVAAAADFCAGVGDAGAREGEEVAQRPLEELPVVLQILLSQVHRLRALVLLKQFVELGHWAVDAALLVGIFPYVLKLMTHHQLVREQTPPSLELRHTLVSIWARILSFDPSCQEELLKDNAHVNFIKHLRWEDMPARQRVLAAFVLTCVMDGTPKGQEKCLQKLLHMTCFELLEDGVVGGGDAGTGSSSPMGLGVAGAGNLGQGLGGGVGLPRRGGGASTSSSLAGSPPPPMGPSSRKGSAGSEAGAGGGGGPGGESGGGRWTGTRDPAVRRWLCLCIAKLCWRYTDAQDACVRHIDSLFSCLEGKDQIVEVRCAAVYALESLYSRGTDTTPAAAAAAAATAKATAAATSAAAAGAAGAAAVAAVTGTAAPPQVFGAPIPGGGLSPMMPQGGPLMGAGPGMYGPGPAVAAGAAGGSMEAWPSLVPDCSPGPGAGGNGAVAGTSETRRLDELGIASRLAKYSKDASPLLRREVVLALGVLVLNPAHFPFFVTVAQELSLDAAAAAAAAAEEDDEEDSDAEEEDGGGAAGWEEGMRPGYGGHDHDHTHRGYVASSPLEINAGGGGGPQQLASSLISNPADVPEGGPSLWGLPSPRLSASVNSGGRGVGEWVGLQIPASQQQQQLQERRMIGGGSVQETGSLPRGLAQGKLLAESQGPSHPLGQKKPHQHRQRRHRGRQRRRRRHKKVEEQPRLSEALLQALGGEAGQQYAVLWKVLETVRDVDPFSHVAHAAGEVIAVVMEQAEAFVAVRRAARAAEEDEEEALALAGTTPVSSSSSADTRVLSWSSSSYSAPGSGASVDRGSRAGDGAGGGGEGGGGGSGAGLAGSPWAASLQAVPPATSGLDQPHLLHAFYKWSCREFGEPVRPPPARVVPDVAGLVAPGSKTEQRPRLPGPGPDGLAAEAERARAARHEETLGGQAKRTLWQRRLEQAAPWQRQREEEVAQRHKQLRLEQQQQQQQRQQQQQQLLRQRHRHDPVDSLSLEGAHHLYLKDRNLGTHELADSLVKGYETLNAPPIREETLSARVRRADLDSEEPPDHKLDLKRHTAIDLGQKRITSSLAFHPYEPLLVVADDRDTITVCNFNTGFTYGSFSNGNRPGSRIQSATWINEAHKSLLLTGGVDGVARVWDGVMEAQAGAGIDGAMEGKMEPPELVTAFQAVPDIATGIDPSMVTHWQQRRGLLTAAGTSPLLRVWDMASEQMWSQWEVPESVDNLHQDSVVTALGAAPDVGGGPLGGWAMVAGTSDGQLLLFDARERGQQTVQRLKGHRMKKGKGKPDLDLNEGAWVVDVYFTEGAGGHEILSGDLQGWITTQDIRKASDSSDARTQKVLQSTGITCMTMHPSIPLLATADCQEFIQVVTPRGQILSQIKEHAGLFDQAQMGPVLKLAFHPNRLVLAAGSLDYRVSVFSPSKDGEGVLATNPSSSYSHYR